ncbi:MAG: replication initiator protein A [Eubacterium sp.]|nr:replication initiator protein A [Eubacterium sp.]
MHDYFHGAQSDQFSFIRVPSVLFTDDQYKNASAEAKILYGLLLSRMELSAKNGWIDEKGRVFIICTTEEIMEKLNCGNQKAVKLMAELEKTCDLIERKRQGLGKPNLIYVKNFLPVDNPVDNASPSHFLKCENHTSGDVKTTLQEVRKSHTNNIEEKYIDLRYTENPISSGWGADGMSDYERYKEWFQTELELDILSQRYPTETETLDGILDLLAETCSSKKKEIRIAGDDKPREVVKSRLMKLNSLHIQYVLDCLKENTSDVKNIKQYLLTTLFNAPATISSYYQAKVNHDFHAPDSSFRLYSGRSSPFEDYSYSGNDSF